MKLESVKYIHLIYIIHPYIQDLLSTCLIKDLELLAGVKNQ